MAAGYVGLSEHSNILSTLLVLVFTYAGPIFWQMSLFYRYFAHWGEDLDEEKRHLLKCCMAEFSVGLLLAVTSVAAVVCLLMHSHLFIWTVFAPKLFFVAVQCIIFIPILIFMLFV